jgi:hypothetical protein
MRYTRIDKDVACPQSRVWPVVMLLISAAVLTVSLVVNVCAQSAPDQKKDAAAAARKALELAQKAGDKGLVKTMRERIEEYEQEVE